MPPVYMYIYIYKVPARKVSIGNVFEGFFLGDARRKL